MFKKQPTSHHSIKLRKVYSVPKPRWSVVMRGNSIPGEPVCTPEDVATHRSTEPDLATDKIGQQRKPTMDKTPYIADARIERNDQIDAVEYTLSI